MTQHEDDEDCRTIDWRTKIDYKSLFLWLVHSLSIPTEILHALSWAYRVVS